jgi:dTDP-4-dehydrorhamnose 3,5-epimerase
VKFTATALAGAYVIEIEPHQDERGFFARTFCRDEFAAHGLCTTFVQANVSSNDRKGTLRGMHFQKKPHEEAKLLCCTRGAIYDVIIDLRAGSPTLGQWASFELSAGNRRLLYVPEGMAHGFQTLEDQSDVLYLMSAMYQPEAAAGVRWNDPAFGISWPSSAPIVSERDARYPDFRR